jgi:hypothetical protein
MYATCLFCHSKLGRDETIEAFPVGLRRAFDDPDRAARQAAWRDADAVARVADTIQASSSSAPRSCRPSA